MSDAVSAVLLGWLVDDQVKPEMSIRTLARQEQQWRSQRQPSRRRAWRCEPFSLKIQGVGKEGIGKEVLDDAADNGP